MTIECRVNGGGAARLWSTSAMRVAETAGTPRTQRRDTAERQQRRAFVRAARAGDHAAFARLVDCMDGYVRRAAGRVLRDEHEVEDVVQETYMAAYTGLSTLSDPGAFEGWLLRIARNRAVTTARKLSRCAPSDRAHLEELDDDASGPRVVSRSGAREPSPTALCALRAAFDDLSPLLRETLRLRYERGLSCEEIAACQAVSMSCVKTRLHRARRHVRDALGVSDSPSATRGTRCGRRG